MLQDGGKGPEVKDVPLGGKGAGSAYLPNAGVVRCGIIKILLS